MKKQMVLSTVAAVGALTVLLSLPVRQATHKRYTRPPGRPRPRFRARWTNSVMPWETTTATWRSIATEVAARSTGTVTLRRT